jgi:chromosome segregation ATPase
MSKDLTQKLNGSLEDKVDWLIAAMQSMESRMESMESRMESMESRMESMESRMESMESRIDSIDARLGSLETKGDERLKDTRPMWEAVQTQLGELRSELKADNEALRHEMEKGFRKLSHKFELHASTLGDLHADWRDHEERRDKLEKVES